MSSYGSLPTDGRSAERVRSDQDSQNDSAQTSRASMFSMDKAPDSDNVITGGGGGAGAMGMAGALMVQGAVSRFKGLQMQRSITIPDNGGRDSNQSIRSSMSTRTRDSMDSSTSSIRKLSINSAPQELIPRRSMAANAKKSISRVGGPQQQPDKKEGAKKKSAIEARKASHKSLFKHIKGKKSGAAVTGDDPATQKYFKLTLGLQAAKNQPQMNSHDQDQSSHQHGQHPQNDHHGHHHHHGHHSNMHDLHGQRHSLPDEHHSHNAHHRKTSDQAPAYRRKKHIVSKMTRAEEEKYMQTLGSSYRQAAYLEKHTYFDQDEVRALMEMYKKCVQGKVDQWDRAMFREIMVECFGMYNDEMLDRMFSFFDSDHEGTISDTEFVQNMSIILRGSLEQHINYCYDIYDFNHDHGISREELNHLFRGCLLNIPTDEDASDHIREIVELALRKFDEHRTGVISRESFRAAVIRDPLLLQGLGPCLPSEKYSRGFMHLFSDNPTEFSTNYSRAGDPGYNHRPRAKHQHGRHASLGFLFHG